jgi:glycosyltransferase involved in cell wall biosynthesis
VSDTITVAIPTIPPRDGYLRRALRSVDAQTLRPDHVSVVVDRDGNGASETRNRAWMRCESDWVAFLDDDDELLPHHLEHLLDVARETNADMVYPWHRIVGAHGQLMPDYLGAQGVPFDPTGLFGCDPALVDDPDEGFDSRSAGNAHNWIPINVLLRRELLVEAGGFSAPPGEACEDWRLWRRLVKLGANIVHTPEITWVWHWHGSNTEGRPERWKGRINAPNLVEAPL